MTRADRRIPGALLVAGAALGLLLAPVAAVSASAHDTLVQSDPASGAAVSSLDRIELTFSADPLGADGADLIQVKGPDGRYYETACPDLNGTDVTAPVALGPAGEYEVLWRIVSSDGHPVGGSYGFSYRPGAAATAAPGSATPQCGQAPSSAPSAEASSAADAPEAGASAPSGLWLGLGIGGVAVIACGFGVWALARGRSADR